MSSLKAFEAEWLERAGRDLRPADRPRDRARGPVVAGCRRGHGGPPGAGELTSTGFCLAAPGKEYLVYLPAQEGRLRRVARSVFAGLVSERAELDLAGTKGSFDVEWIDVERGMIMPGAPVTGGERIVLRAPFAGDAMVHLTARQKP